MTAHAAHLRVYEPLAAFPAQERRDWESYVASGAAPSPATGPDLERAAALRAAARRPPGVLPQLPEHAYVRSVDGVTVLCPWRSELRVLEALEEYVADLPDEVVEAFLPLAVARGAGEQLDQWRAAHPEQRGHQLTSTWHVPSVWFVVVDADEREVRLGQPAGGGTAPAGRRLAGRSLVYRTAMSRARRRTARALAVLRRSLGDDEVTGRVEDLGRWLEEFHPRSLVELDYGGLVHLLPDADLSQDESARDIAASLAALGAGDSAAAAEAYGRVTARAKALQAVESAN